MSSSLSQTTTHISHLHEAQDTDNMATAPERISMEARVRKMGPWDQVMTPELLAGPLPLPMPVEIAQQETLSPIFQHLEKNGDASAFPEEKAAATRGAMMLSEAEEMNYLVPFLEFEKGVIYADRRVDLCKMVLGPPNIEALLDSLENNTFIRHFLLGNNIIGPVGAKRIARFIHDHPDRMDTWYLAGNCIDAQGFRDIVDGLVDSVATNVWLKRNPLMPTAVHDIVRLIRQSNYLRTLDLDQTGLGDAGVSLLFDMLADSGAEGHTLEHLYLNGNGAAVNSCSSIAKYLVSPSCRLKSLFLANNLLGDAGIDYLAESMSSNSSIERLMLGSVGMTSQGASKLFRCLNGHQTLISLDVGQSYATEDLGTRFNWIDDDSLPAIWDLIQSNTHLRYLHFSRTAISRASMNKIMDVAISNNSLCWFVIETIDDTPVKKVDLLARKLREELKTTLAKNVARLYNGIDYSEFEAKVKRTLTGPEEDVRKTDSVYRNRDAALAKRGLKILDKKWDEDDSTLREVMDWKKSAIQQSYP